MDEKGRQVLQRIQSNSGTFKQPSRVVEDNTHPKVVSTMNELFARLKAITAVGHAFDASTEHIVKQEWILAFAQEGIKSQAIIDKGIEAIRVKSRKSRGTTWFPSIGEFIDACLGSDNKLEYAERALKLFNSGQKQIDNVGRMVTGNHGFDLKQMKAADTNKRFIELYLVYAENTPIEALESHLLTETVQLSPQQRREAEDRAEAAKSEFFNRFSVLINDRADKR